MKNKTQQPKAYSKANNTTIVELHVYNALFGSWVPTKATIILICIRMPEVISTNEALLDTDDAGSRTGSTIAATSMFDKLRDSDM